jgi:hypothetical protein
MPPAPEFVFPPDPAPPVLGWLLEGRMQPSSITAVVVQISSKASPETDTLPLKELALRMDAALSSM